MIYFSSKNTDYLKLSLFWISLIFNFIIQAATQDSVTAIIYGYGFAIVPLTLLGYSSISFIDQKYPWKFILPTALASLIITTLIIDLPISFTLKALPFAAAAAFPLLHTFYVYMFKKGTAQVTPLMKFHAFVVLLLAIHTFNFAFFRMEPDAQLWGWPIAYALYQLLAGLIPALTIDFYYRKEEVRLQKIIETKTNELRLTNSDLNKALQQKKYLFRTLTHDISTPLSIAQLKIQLFKSNPATTDLDSFVNKMADLTLLMEQLVNQVRTFESIQSDNNIPINQESLIQCINVIETIFEDRFLSKKIKFNYDKEELSKYHVDVDLNSFINSVLMNIISNSIKFCRIGGAIEISALKDSDGKIKITIEDNGIGMPDEIKNNLFDFESKTSRRGTSNEPGTGFGAPIVQKLLTAYGGKVEVESQEQADGVESFTRFTLTLNGIRHNATQTA